MNMIARAPEWGELIHADRVRGSLYRDPAIFQLELERILVPHLGLCRPRKRDTEAA